MNEITQVHLGRQAFTIAVDAHKSLQAYLHAIKRHMGDTDEAVEEVELRMAELLTERGITSDKVVLQKDVDYLKQQLGEPGDFGDEDTADTPKDSVGAKRLFRDTDHAMIAGVASGIAKYVGIDPLWVRLAFVALTFAGASGILIYILLWVLIPEAKTSSERLQMQGKSVTVDALKDAVVRADVQGAAHRAGRTIGRVSESMARVLLAIIGIGFLLVAFGLLAGAATGATYLWTHGFDIAATTIFPVGLKETLLVVCGASVLALAAILFATAGRSMIIRKWTLPTWATAAIILLFICAASVGTALGFSTAPAISQRYAALDHSQWRPQPVFAQAHMQLGDVELDTQNDASYGVEIRTLGNVDTSTIVTKVIGGNGGQLVIDASHFKGPAHRCILVCPYGPTNTEIVIHGPLPFRDLTPDGFMNFDPQIAPPDFKQLMPMPEAAPAKPTTVTN